MRLTRNAKRRETRVEGRKAKGSWRRYVSHLPSFSSLHFALYTTKLHNFETSLMSLCSCNYRALRASPLKVPAR